MEHVERVIQDNPSFHSWPDGSPANWSVSPDALRFLAAALEVGMRTLETGAGQTTVVFAMAGTDHVCITPQPEHAERVRQYCAALGVTPRIRFLHESSDRALARDGVVPESLDVVFIDGAHRFPFPCIDWHYTERSLRVGGVLGVDDYCMPSVKVLYDFLCGEDEWCLLATIDRTAFFEKLADAPVVMDCHGQRLNRRFLLQQH